jgi:NADH-quinone oxidoreductase subunit J
VFAFEATSALLITAALGAMVLAHRERLSKKRGQAELVTERIKKYAETGQHPGPLPTPGVFARHNAVDTPALLPDGSEAITSGSATLRARGSILDSRDLAKPIQRTLHQLDPDAHSDPDDHGGPSLPVSTDQRRELGVGPSTGRDRDDDDREGRQ